MAVGSVILVVFLWFVDVNLLQRKSGSHRYVLMLCAVIIIILHIQKHTIELSYGLVCLLFIVESFAIHSVGLGNSV